MLEGVGHWGPARSPVSRRRSPRRGLFFRGTVRGMDRGGLIRRVRTECGEWALEAVVLEVGSARAPRAVLEGLARAEDALELETQTAARVTARGALRGIRRGLEVELHP